MYKKENSRTSPYICYIQWNPNFGLKNLDLKSGVKLWCLTEEGKRQLLVQVIEKLEFRCTVLLFSEKPEFS